MDRSGSSQILALGLHSRLVVRDHVRGDPGFDQSPNLIDHREIHRAFGSIAGRLLKALETSRGCGRPERLKGTSFRQCVYALARRLTDGRCGTTSSRSTKRKIFPENSCSKAFDAVSLPIIGAPKVTISCTARKLRWNRQAAMSASAPPGYGP